MGKIRGESPPKPPAGSHRASRTPSRPRAQLPTFSVVAAGLAVTAVAAGGAVLTASPSPSNAESLVNARRTGAERLVQQASDRRASLSRDASRVATGDGPGVSSAVIEQLQKRRVQALADLQASARRQATLLALNTWGSPLAAYRLTARFGDSSSLWSTTHTGLDLAAPAGTPIRSVAGGVVTAASYDGSYGYKVVVSHQDGTETWYAHMSELNTQVGQRVTSESVIGYVGSTGNVTGPHLHLEVRPGGRSPVDPYQAMLDHGVRL